MTTSITLDPLYRNPITGRLESGYFPPDPDSSWRVATAYRLAHHQTMQVVHPRPEAGVYAAHKWSDSNMDHEVKISWVGDDAPPQVS